MPCGAARGISAGIEKPSAGVDFEFDAKVGGIVAAAFSDLSSERGKNKNQTAQGASRICVLTRFPWTQRFNLDDAPVLTPDLIFGFVSLWLGCLNRGFSFETNEPHFSRPPKNLDKAPAGDQGVGWKVNWPTHD
jgi:hypothetical protein